MTLLSPQQLSSVPRLVSALESVRVVQIAVGVSHTAVLITGGKIISFGSNEYGELGTGLKTLGETHGPMRTMLFAQPEKSGGHQTESKQGYHTNHVVRKVTCGRGFTICLTTMGTVFSCGRSSYGCLGNGNGNGNGKSSSLVNQVRMCQVVGLACLPI